MESSLDMDVNFLPEKKKLVIVIRTMSRTSSDRDVVGDGSDGLLCQGTGQVGLFLLAMVSAVGGRVMAILAIHLVISQKTCKS